MNLLYTTWALQIEEIAMQTINISNVLGHIGSDPQHTQLPNGTLKTVVSIATNIGTGDRQKVQWHTALFWGKTAEVAAKLKKGDALFVSGYVDYRKWNDKETGQPREKTEIHVQHFSKVENPMQTINQINILGNIGADALFKQFGDNAKTTISVATNIGSGDRQKAQWHTVIFWGKAAEVTAKLKKGDALFVNGYIETRKWTDANSGQNREKTEIHAQQFSIISGQVGQISNHNIEPSQQQVGYGNIQENNYSHNGYDKNPNDFDQDSSMPLPY
ncbi:MAG: single-stranded DNA-binding protein [Comamonas sp.]|nr:single-stranded DNA-binding protein [Comamonas sp.]